MIIRRETPQDFDEIYILIQTVFQTARVSDGTEQDFAVNLRKSKNYINELALIAETEEGLVGHIMLTALPLISPKTPIKALMAAPLSVLESHQGKGIGAQLMNAALTAARQMYWQTAGDCLIFIYKLTIFIK